MQDVGHYLHEVSGRPQLRYTPKSLQNFILSPKLVLTPQDDPARLAQTLVAFWRRNTQTIVLPPKIGTLGTPAVVKHVGET